ncbi:hypothetical protein ACFVUS_27400 [Nocardia sp. NPDC058058]|uniref:hypothetical protein n=1 Tax=Nocardia sp. NPDC058058 TaxID=3346317 RepID=UPI0036DEB096
MRRSVIALLLGFVAVAVPACDGTDGPGFPSTSNTTPAGESASGTSDVIIPPKNSRSVSVPSAISPSALRRKVCEDLLPKLQQTRDQSGQPGVDKAVADAIAAYPTTADWSVFTPEQQQASINGAQDAGTGKCST